MVGHTGVVEAGIKAVETVDECIAPNHSKTSRARRQMPDHRRSRKLRADAQRRRLTEHRAHQQPCAFHLRRQRCSKVSLRRRNSGRCGADSFVFARTAAAKRDDRAQFARAYSVAGITTPSGSIGNSAAIGPIRFPAVDLALGSRPWRFAVEGEFDPRLSCHARLVFA